MNHDDVLAMLAAAREMGPSGDAALAERIMVHIPSPEPSQKADLWKRPSDIALCFTLYALNAMFIGACVLWVNNPGTGKHDNIGLAIFVLILSTCALLFQNVFYIVALVEHIRRA